MHPNTRDYTFYSPVHEMYTRIDYIMVDHKVLEWVTDLNIEIDAVRSLPHNMKMTTGIQRPPL